MLGRTIPRSKRDATIPYTYEVQVDRLRGQGSEPLDCSYFADTICGLVQLMIDEDISPTEARFYGAFRKELVELDVQRCLDNDGNWMTPPELCHELEQYYSETLDKRFRGHVEVGECLFEDRDTEGHGPY